MMKRERPSMAFTFSVEPAQIFDPILLDQTVTCGEDEICIRRLLTGGAQLACDLSAMIRRVQQDMSQDIFHGAGPRLALGVFVFHFLREPGSSKLAEEFAPSTREVSDLLAA